MDIIEQEENAALEIEAEAEEVCAPRVFWCRRVHKLYLVFTGSPAFKGNDPSDAL